MSQTSPPIQCAVFDFDGTLTDAERHAGPFHDASRSELAAALGVALESVERDWREERERLAAEPPESGFVVAGQTVAPASADPYLVANTIVLRLVERAGAGGGDPVAQARVVSEVHRAAYRRVPTPLRPEAAEVLDAVVARGIRVHVVSNSDGVAISQRLDSAGLRERDAVRVYGHAQKFLVVEASARDARFDALPATADLAGLRRPVFLRRGRYFDVLRRIWDDCGAAPAATLVCGDIFELDLAMPAALGAAVHLMARPSTLPHELRAALASPRGGAGEALRSVLERI